MFSLSQMYPTWGKQNWIKIVVYSPREINSNALIIKLCKIDNINNILSSIMCICITKQYLYITKLFICQGILNIYGKLGGQNPMKPIHSM
jgi:hypothetical protein